MSFLYDRVTNRMTYRGKNVTKEFIRAMLIFLTDYDAPLVGESKTTQIKHDGEVKWEIKITKVNE